jgi:Protein of unknown function (DUF3891)
VIVRSVGPSQLLITQPDHAALAARIMNEWRAGGFPDASRRSDILFAIAEHDNGWREVDATPIVDQDGRVHDFVSAPDPIKWSIWPRAVERLATRPYAAALVAQHAVHVYRHKRDDKDWTPFFSEMEALRDRYLQAARIAMDDLLKDYPFVRIGDLASLTFCNGWSEQQVDDVRHAIRFDGSRLTISPDPFEGRQFAIEVNARELPKRAFRSAAELQTALAAAPVVSVSAIAAGA